MMDAFKRKTRANCSLSPNFLYRLCITGAVVVCLLAPGTAYAAVLTVNNLTDVSNGSCATTCTLRGAMTLAAAGDTIVFSLSGTITLNSTLPIVTTALTIDGTGQSVTISGNNSVGVLTVVSGNLTLKNLTLRNGASGNGGAVDNVGTVTIVNSTFSGNSATSGNGGAVNNGGTMTIVNSTFSGNSATLGLGGAVENGGTMTIQNSTFSGNSAASGGGAVDNERGMTIVNSTFSGNSTGGGGAVENSAGTMTIQNSTFSGNSTGGSGGGVSNYGNLVLGSSIVAGNTASIGGPDIYYYVSAVSAVTSLGYNLIGDGTSSGLTNGTNHDQVGTAASPINAFLAPLANNGGPTQTSLLQPGSPAIGNGNCALASPGITVTSDQRGIPRKVVGVGCDIGAFETPAATSTATSAQPSTAVTYGTSQTFTATVSSGGSAVTSGTVTFTDTTTSATLATGVPLDANGLASISVTLGAGVQTIRATYVPDIGHSGSIGDLTNVIVNKATLTVTANNITANYGTASTFTAAITGFVNSDPSSVVTGSASFSTNATTTNGKPNAGSWTITPTNGTLAASNYTFGAFTAGTLTVNKAVLTVSANNVSSTQGFAIPPLTAAITGFVNGDTSAVVTGTPSLTTTATATSSPGTYPITVTQGTLAAVNYTFNLVNGTLTVLQYTYPVPVLTSITPSQLPAGSPDTKITLNGSGFVSGSAVLIGSTSVSTTFTGSSTISATVPAGLLASGGNLTVTVLNPTPGGGTSQGVQLQVINPSPVITAAVPRYLVAGQAPSLILSGNGFVPVSTVQVNGTNRIVTFISGGQLTVTLNAADVAASGLLTVTVASPAPGGGTSSITVAVMNPGDVPGLTLPPGVTVIKSGGAGPLTAGYGGIRLADAGTSSLSEPQDTSSSLPAVFARWTETVGGVTVNEATVPSVVPLTSGRIYAMVTTSINTGIAIANPNASPVTVSYVFTDMTGKDFGSGSLTIPANGQIAQFLSQAPFSLPVGTEATMSFSSTLPVGVVSLRGVTNSNGSFFATPLPVTDLSASPATGELVVPQFTDGAGWSTSVLLVNPTGSELTGTVQFIDRTSGQPVAITVNGITANQFNYALPAKSGTRITTSGTSASMATGSIVLYPNLFNNELPSAQAIFTYQAGGNVLSESGMAGALPAASAQIYVESIGDFAHGASAAVESGIAIANAGVAAESVNLQFTVLNGAASTAQATIMIPAGGQFTGFLNQIPGFQNLPNPLEGIISVSTADGTSNLVLSALRARYNEVGGFLLSSVPLIRATPPPAGTELIIPQVVDGGGFTTSLILLNTSSTPENVLLRTMSVLGQPLNLSFK